MSACDDKAKDAGSAASRSGVAGDKSVAETSTEDVRQLCRWMQEVVGDLEISDEQDCTADVIDDGASASECEELVEACLEEPAPEPASDAAAQCDAIEKPAFPEGCSQITVKDYESCVTSLKSAIESYINGLTCADDAGQDIVVPRVAACEKLREHCPQILPPPAR
jgi:predicted RNase H-like HicB family nuclease